MGAKPRATAVGLGPISRCGQGLRGDWLGAGPRQLRSGWAPCDQCGARPRTPNGGWPWKPKWGWAFEADGAWLPVTAPGTRRGAGPGTRMQLCPGSRRGGGSRNLNETGPHTTAVGLGVGAVQRTLGWAPKSEWGWLRKRVRAGPCATDVGLDPGRQCGAGPNATDMGPLPAI